MKCFYLDNLDCKCAASLVLRNDLTDSNLYQNRDNLISVSDLFELPIERVRKNEYVYILGFVYKEPLLKLLDKLLTITKKIIIVAKNSYLFINKFKERYGDSINILHVGKNESVSCALYKFFSPKETLPLFIKYMNYMNKFPNDKNVLGFKVFLLNIETNPYDYIWEGLVYSEVNVQDMIVKGKILRTTKGEC